LWEGTRLNDYICPHKGKFLYLIKIPLVELFQNRLVGNFAQFLKSMDYEAKKKKDIPDDELAEFQRTYQ